MAQMFYNIELKGASFPMLTEQQARTTISGALASARAITLAGAKKAGESPSVAYCHNVMPSKYGLDSVGYLSVVTAFSNLPAGLSMTDVRIAYGDNRSRLYLAWDSEGNVYALLGGATSWLAIPATNPVTGGAGFKANSVTIGTVNGISYILYSKIGAFTFNETTNSLDAVTLTGLTITEVLGVTASSGYLIAYTAKAIAWSSTILANDFVPSLTTGAGGGDVAGISGAILFTTPNTLGILISTSANTIAGTYTGNARFPFKFREVADSKGGLDLDSVAYEANSAQQFIYSKAGLQVITSQRAEVILPEVTDFLAGGRFEDYNETTKLYEITDLLPTETMLKKIKLVSSRYLVISYGLPSTGFTHAIVFDLSLKRLGKLKLAHTDVFEYIGGQPEISREAVAFLLPTGEVKVLDFSVSFISHGVVILGKLEFSASRWLNLLGIALENVESSATLDVSSQASYDGKNFTSILPTDSSANAGLLRYYPFRATAKSHSIVIIGQFNLTTALITYAVAGRR